MLKILIIAFMVLATMFSVGSLSYVVIDIIIVVNRKKYPEPEPQPVVVVREPEPEPIPEPEPEPEPIPEPIPEPEPEPIVIEVVEHINAEEADELIPDEVVEQLIEEEVIEEEPETTGFRTYINLGVLDANFESGDTITIDELKERKLIPSKAKRVKILADGELTKAFTIKAHSFSTQAVKMIKLTGGTVIKKK